MRCWNAPTDRAPRGRGDGIRGLHLRGQGVRALGRRAVGRRVVVSSVVRSSDARRRGFLGDESGSASLEFLAAGTLLLVPLVYLVLAVSALQSASFAVEGAARHAARVFVDTGSGVQGSARAEAAIAVALTDAGLEPGAAQVAIVCAPDPHDCGAAGTMVTVSVTVSAALPLMPAALSVDAPLTVPVQASASQRVHRFVEDP